MCSAHILFKDKEKKTGKKASAAKRKRAKRFKKRVMLILAGAKLQQIFDICKFFIRKMHITAKKVVFLGKRETQEVYSRSQPSYND
jgi:hypothetical protein